MEKNVIEEVTRKVKINGNTILEKGDKIEVINGKKLKEQNENEVLGLNKDDLKEFIEDSFSTMVGDSGHEAIRLYLYEEDVLHLERFINKTSYVPDAKKIGEIKAPSDDVESYYGINPRDIYEDFTYEDFYDEFFKTEIESEFLFSVQDSVDEEKYEPYEKMFNEALEEAEDSIFSEYGREEVMVENY